MDEVDDHASAIIIKGEDRSWQWTTNKTTGKIRHHHLVGVDVVEEGLLPIITAWRKYVVVMFVMVVTKTTRWIVDRE